MAEQEAFAKGREAADHALALAPELGAAQIARGLVLQQGELNWRGAASEFRRAMELAPKDEEAMFWYGNQLATLGEVARAVGRSALRRLLQ